MPVFTVSGFSLLRLLSDRERSKVYLAQTGVGSWCALKFQKPLQPSDLPALNHRNARLKSLTGQVGLLQILSHGCTTDGWVWKALTLADNIPGLPELGHDSAHLHYTAETLLRWKTPEGALPTAAQTAQWGIRIAQGLETLHMAGLVHRDVKPSNIFFVNGKPCLGDYGLAGDPGGKVDYRGTEGFQPLEGTDAFGADLYALGKTLYECWTGENRLEFPSLPRHILDAPEWKTAGRHLNEVLLRACHHHARKRFHSASDFRAALEKVAAGDHPTTRRRWLAISGACVAAPIGLYFLSLHGRAPIKLMWRRLTHRNFNVESWKGHTWTFDWAKRRIHSFQSEVKGAVYTCFDLDRGSLNSQLVQTEPIETPAAIFHPETHQLWIVSGGRGQVHALDLTSLELNPIGGGKHDSRHFDARVYWNPISRRIGTFGGYGYFAARNDRAEFDAASHFWVELDPDAPTNDRPWRRTGEIPFVPQLGGGSLFLIGGYGSLSGQQGASTPGARGFDGRFHWLDDVWELNLKSNNWRRLLPPGRFDDVVLKAAAFFPQFNALVAFQGMKIDDQKSRVARALLIPGIQDNPQPLPLQSSGDVSRLSKAWTYGTDPNTGDFFLLADDGIFQVSASPT